MGTFLRFYSISAQSLWDDEISTIDYTGQTIGEMWKDLPVRDANPPLFYFIFHYWRQLGTSEFSYRFFPAIMGALALVLGFLIVRRLSDDSVALLAMLLLSVNPLSIYCSQEVRSHTILLVLCLSSILFYLRLLDYGRLRDLAGWVVVTSLAAYTHYFSFFLIFFLCIHYLIVVGKTICVLKNKWKPFLFLSTLATSTYSWSVQARAIFTAVTLTGSIRLATRRLWLFLAGLVLVGILYLPWIKSLMMQMMKGQSWRPYLPPWSLLKEYWIYATVGHSATRLPGFFSPLEGMQDGGPLDMLKFSAILLALLLPFLVLLIYGITTWTKNSFSGKWLVLVWAFVPILILLAVTQKVHLFDYRHILPFIPPLFFFMASGLNRLRTKSFTAFSMACSYVCLLPILSLSQYYNDPAFAKQDWRGAFQLINQSAKPGDIILSYHSKKALGLSYYSDGSIPIHYVVPEEGYTQKTIEEEKAAMKRRVENVASQEGRVWLVDYHGIVFDRFDITRKTLKENSFLAFQKSFMKGPRRYTIELYTPDFEEAAASFLTHVDFKALDHSPGQILDGWFQQAKDSRWMSVCGRVLLKNIPDIETIEASFYAPFKYLGGKPFDVSLQIEGELVGSVTVNAEGIFTVTGPVPENARQARFIKVSLCSAKTFRPSDILGVPDTTEKSLLVMQMRLKE